MKTKVLVSWSAVILWMALIFAFSAQPAKESTEVSLSVTAIIIRFFGNLSITSGVNTNWIGEMDHIVRKSAHAFVFFVLAILAVNAFMNIEVKRISAFLFAFILTILYACTDEIHQLFVPGRACMLTDVGIDSLGALFGLFLFGLGYWMSGIAKVRLSRN